MVIPEAAVEAAIQASYRKSDWGDENNRQFIERALEAAAPHMKSAREKSFNIETDADDGLLWWALASREPTK